MPKKQIFTHVPTHMRRFSVPHLTSSNRQLIYLHIICQFSLDDIATMAAISRKTVTRILMGQKATEKQLRRLQRACTPVYRELEKELDYARTRSLEGHYYREMLHHMISYGRWLTQDTRRDRT